MGVSLSVGHLMDTLLLLMVLVERVVRTLELVDSIHNKQLLVDTHKATQVAIRKDQVAIHNHRAVIRKALSADTRKAR